MNLNGSVVLDIDSLVQLSLDKSSGGSSPKTTVGWLYCFLSVSVFYRIFILNCVLQKALSRKNCGRMERRSCEDVEIDDPSRKNIVKGITNTISLCYFKQ